MSVRVSQVVLPITMSAAMVAGGLGAWVGSGRALSSVTDNPFAMASRRAEVEAETARERHEADLREARIEAGRALVEPPVVSWSAKRTGQETYVLKCDSSVSFWEVDLVAADGSKVAVIDDVEGSTITRKTIDSAKGVRVQCMDKSTWDLMDAVGLLPVKESLDAADAAYEDEVKAAEEKRAAEKAEEERKAEAERKAKEDAKKAEEEAKAKENERLANESSRLSDEAARSSDARVFDLAPDKSKETESVWVKAWGDAIDSYLDGRGDVPLRGYGRKFAQAAWDHDCDPRISVCISETESGNGQICFMPYNAWGWLGQSFSSFDEGIDKHAEYLSSFYGMPFTKDLYATYCGGENTDYLWDWIWSSASTIRPSA